MTQQEYYNNSSEWGEYQYLYLSDIINNYLMSRGDTDFTKFEPRYRILYHARRGLRELYYDVLRDIRGVKLTISPTLSIPLPPDYINYVRISWVDSNGLLHPMAINRKISTVQGYLQDHQYNILFDGSGCALTESEENSKYGDTSDSSESSGCSSYNFCSTFQPNKDMSNSFPNGTFNINSSLGIVQFSSDVKGKDVVLEYISDGLAKGCDNANEDFKIHKFAESALINYIYYELIKQTGVPMNEKIRARKEYYNSRRIAKRRINTIRADELRQVFKGASKWIK